jgi:hypothetical protein
MLCAVLYLWSSKEIKSHATSFKNDALKQVKLLRALRVLLPYALGPLRWWFWCFERKMPRSLCRVDLLFPL